MAPALSAEALREVPTCAPAFATAPSFWSSKRLHMASVLAGAEARAGAAKFTEGLKGPDGWDIEMCQLVLLIPEYVCSSQWTSVDPGKCMLAT